MKVQVEGSQAELAANRDMLAQAMGDLLDEADHACASDLCKAGNSTAYGNHPKAALNDLRRIWVEGYAALMGEMTTRLKAAIQEYSPGEAEVSEATIEGMHLDLDRNPRGEG